MAAIFPANFQEFLTFLPNPPRLGPRPLTKTTTAPYTANNILTPAADRPILSRIDLTLIPRLIEFLTSRVGEFNIGDVSCQEMLPDLHFMQACRLTDENSVGLYGEYVTRAIDPIVHIIAEAAHIDDSFTLQREHVTDLYCSQRPGGDYTFVLLGENADGQATGVCSDEDKAYAVLLSKAEDLSRSIRLDATRKQEGTAAMAVKLALQMITSRVEYGIFLGGFIAIAAQLVRSTDASRPGHILLLSPAFKLSRAPLVHPDPTQRLTQFQANIQPEPFLAIVVAMIFSKLLPGRCVAAPPPNLLQPQSLETIQDAEEGREHDEEDSHGGDKVDQSDFLNVPLQVATNAMVLHHPWLQSSDIHRISLKQDASQPFMDINLLTASSKSSGLVTKTFLQSLPAPRSLSQLCRRSPHTPSTNRDLVSLVSQVMASRWSTVWKCRAEGREESFIIKLVPETHSDMIWREFYMYEVVLKECPSLVPRFYGMFQRPAGGWFAFYLEDVGDTLETAYDLGWSGVKRSMPEMQWQKLLELVKQLHSLGVLHGDLEPRNVAQTAEGFKFFDFGHSELHHCQLAECDELQNLLSV